MRAGGNARRRCESAQKKDRDARLREPEHQRHRDRAHGGRMAGGEAFEIVDDAKRLEMKRSTLVEQNGPRPANQDLGKTDDDPRKSHGQE